MRTVHIVVKGKVQGVFFRATAKDKAEQLRIKGWVKNTRSGDVEIMAAGEYNNVLQFIDWCRQGPPKARVSELVIEEKADEIFERFEILR